MSFMPPMSGFPGQQPQPAITPTRAVMPVFGGAAQPPPPAGPPPGLAMGQMPLAPQPAPGPEVNNPQPLPAIRGAGNMHAGAVARLRGVHPNMGRPY